MKFGAGSPRDQSVAKLVDRTVEVEKLGYDSILVSDHVNADGLDAWTLLSYLAAKTTNLRLGTLVTPVPRYVPAQLARWIASVDVLSNGRTIAGFGAGYNWVEFKNYAPDGIYPEPRERVNKCIEAMRLIMKLWSAATAVPTPWVNFKGKYYSVVDGQLWPKPVQKPHPPVWYGGTGDYTLATTAKYCDGWICPTYGWVGLGAIEAYEAKVKKIQEYAKEYNRDMSKFTFVVTSTLADTAEKVEKFKAAGCQYYIVGQTPPNDVGDLRKFANEVIPSFQ
jgi:alkanesulfonate monooxygenase SsuD/methylene tetrahydromethanopterin reductase-like flavin-dependent oxidoreductase (luciferase family)